jgi:hypothetical protein
MVSRICRNALIIGVVLSPYLTVSAVAQPKNHIGEDLATIIIDAGCKMTDSDALAAMRAQGLGTSDYQAQVLALHRGGYLTSNDGGKTLQLIKWGACK